MASIQEVLKTAGKKMDPEKVKEKEKERREKNLEKVKESEDSAFNRLTPKEKGFVHAVAVERKTKRQAVVENYNTKSERNAGVMATEISQRPRVQEAITEIYRGMDINEQLFAKTLKEGLEARRWAYDKKIGTYVKSEAPDHKNRLGFLKEAHEIFGIKKGSGDQTKVNINVDMKGNEEVEETVKEALFGKFRKKEGEVIDVTPEAVNE